MPARVSPSLLSTYLVAAARQAGEGAELSARSRWAIDHARHQLKASRDVLSGQESFLGSNSSSGPTGVGILEANGTSELAEIALRGGPELSAGVSIEDRERLAVKRLDGVLSDLEALESERPSAEAAARLFDLFASQPRVVAA
jgi:hypothetical protein